jgi:hypothetical protein
MKILQREWSSPITSNRISWKLRYQNPLRIHQQQVHRLLQIGLVGNLGKAEVLLPAA